MILKEKRTHSDPGSSDTGEKAALKKYGKYAQQARDPELKKLISDSSEKKSRSITIP